MSKRKQNIGYYVGVDVGQAQEPTAIAVVERDFDEEGEDYGLLCSYLQTLPGGTTYPEVASRLARIEESLLSRGADSLRLLVDVTNQGQPVIDLIRRRVAGELIASQFTAGTAAVSEGKSWKIPKMELVTELKIMLQTGRLKIAGRGRDQEQERAVSEMLRELEAFQYDQPREEILEIKVGPRDSLVTALGLAVWLAREYRASGPTGGLLPFIVGVKSNW